MHTSALRNRGEYLALVALSFALLFGGIYLTRSYVMDDALITLRYSFNLARHGHAIWNQADASDPSLGYTTILWMLVNAIPVFFTNNKDLLVLSCKLIGLIPLAVIVLLLVGPISRMPVPRSFRIGIILAIFSQVVYGFHFNSGMETLLFSCLILLAVGTYAQSARSAQAYLFGTLAFLTRPEGALIVALMVLWDLRQRRIRQAALGCVCFSIAALSLGLALHASYGSVLPNAFYVKQGYASLGSLKITIKFLATIALPYLPLAAYSVYGLKDTLSRYCWSAAAVFTAYYLTVTPLMNVFSRYQWPVLVLLTSASLPAFQKLGEGIAGPAATGRRQLAVAVLALFAVVNLRSARVASQFASIAGSQERILIALGKAMASQRDENRWMAYRDAGALCYYSDWNAYDTMGLNTRPIATGSIQPMQVYGYRNTDLVLLNCGDDPRVMSWQDCRETGVQLRELGYHYAGSIPIHTEGAKQHWMLLLFARDLPRGKRLLRSLHAASDLPESPLTRVEQQITEASTVVAPRFHQINRLAGPKP
jgi:hypothetical protein